MYCTYIGHDLNFANTASMMKKPVFIFKCCAISWLLQHPLPLPCILCVLSFRSTMTKPVPNTVRSQSTEAIDNLFQALTTTTTTTTTTTKAGWCLKEAIDDTASVDDGRIASLIEKYGLPGLYFEYQNLCRHDATQDIEYARTSFQSLVRTTAGQFVSGKSAQAAWKRVLEISGNDLTPAVILQMAAFDIESKLQITAGLTKAKAKAASLADLANGEQLSRRKTFRGIVECRQ
jgi:hypothetical protein